MYFYRNAGNLEVKQPIPLKTYSEKKKDKQTKII
jgi:hypothetical protein